DDDDRRLGRDGRPRTMVGAAARREEVKRISELNEKEAMKQITQTIALAAALATLLSAPVRAEDVKAGDLVITQAWSRATPSGAKVAGGYLTVENKGKTADRLVSGSGDIAGRVEIHEMAMDGGVMTMRPLDKGLVIDPGKTGKFAPGGNHLILLGIKTPAKQSEQGSVN